MAYTKSPRPYKKEWELEQKRNEKKSRAARARLRRKVDANGVDKNGNGKADKREGKDIAHKKALSKGGKNKDGYTIHPKLKIGQVFFVFFLTVFFFLSLVLVSATNFFLEFLLKDRFLDLVCIV